MDTRLMIQMIKEKKSIGIQTDDELKQSKELSKRERELQWILHGGKYPVMNAAITMIEDFTILGILSFWQF